MAEGQSKITKEEFAKVVLFLHEHSLQPFIDKNGEEYYWLDRDGLHGMPMKNKKSQTNE